MINPEMINKVDSYYTDGGNTILDIKSLPYFDDDIYDLCDEKSYKKYMSDLERIVRNSFEYRQLIGYLRNTDGMNICSFLDNVTNVDNNKVKIEIHHSPLTLYDICNAVMKKRQHNRESMDILLVAEEVMYLHYLGWVGLIPLSETIHDMVHNNYLFVPTDRVRGNYRAFVESYYNFIDPDTLDSLDAAEIATKEYNNKQMQIFNQHKIYVNVNGSYGLPKMSDIQALLKGRIDAIKNNKVPMIINVNK